MDEADYYYYTNILCCLKLYMTVLLLLIESFITEGHAVGIQLSTNSSYYGKSQPRVGNGQFLSCVT